MAYIKTRLRVKTADGYDTYHLEGRADQVLRVTSGAPTTTNVEDSLAALETTTATHSTDIVNLKSGSAITALAVSKLSALTASRALVTNTSGKITVSAVTDTELGYLDGVTSAIQTQLNGKSATSHTHNYAGSSSAGGAATTALTCTGNAATATTLATARTIGLSGVTATAASFNGSANVTIAVSAVPASLLTGTIDIARIPKGAIPYLAVVEDQEARYALTTATVQNGDTVLQSDTQTMYYVVDETKLNAAAGYEVYRAGAAASVDWTAVQNRPSFATVATSGSYTDLTNKPTIYGPSSATPLVAGTAAAGTSTAFARGDHVHPVQTTVSGNAGTATTLATARTINGTSFNGSANITTANWGTARTITIGDTGKSVNGSANVAWTVSEIGAAAASHTHNYAGSSSAGGAATSAVQLANARTIRTNLSSTSTASFNGTANITPGITGTLALGYGGTGATNAAAARTNLGVVNVLVSATEPTSQATGDLWFETIS